jgi:hypothetical protein
MSRFSTHFSISVSSERNLSRYASGEIMNDVKMNSVLSEKRPDYRGKATDLRQIKPAYFLINKWCITYFDKVY